MTKNSVAETIVTDTELIRILRRASDEDIVELLALVRQNAGSKAVLDDMRLRNTAPDLLAVLKRVIASAVPNPNEHPTMFAAWLAADVVIAKAEGREIATEAR